MTLTTKVFNAKSPMLILLIACFIPLLLFGQEKRFEKTGFTLAKQGNNNVVLYKLSSNSWKPVGSTGRAFIRSLAVDSKNGLIYAVDNQELGTLNASTGKFTSIGKIGNGTGEAGNIKIEFVQGLAFDANQQVLYATQRTSKHDILFKINPKTGGIITQSLVDRRGRRADYKIIMIETYYFGSVYESRNLVDLAYDNNRKTLYISYNYFSTLFGINSYSNIDTQKPTENSRISPVSKLAGIALDEEGKFYVSFSNNQITRGGAITGGGVTVDLGNLNSIDSKAANNTLFLGLDFSDGPVNTPLPAPTCNNNMALNSSPSSNTTIRALQTIQSRALIYVDTKLIAGESVTLNNYFQVRKSANFEIQIDEDVCR